MLPCCPGKLFVRLPHTQDTFTALATNQIKIHFDGDYFFLDAAAMQDLACGVNDHGIAIAACQ